MKLEKLIDMYTGATSNIMRLCLANGEIIETTATSYTRYDAVFHVLEQKLKCNDRPLYPWLELRDKYAETDISEFSVIDGKIIFWEGDEYNV